MRDDYYIITGKSLFDLFGRLAESHRVIVPYRKRDAFQFGDFDPRKESDIELFGIRQNQPLKSFLNPPREKMLDDEAGDTRPLVIAGVKGCDLSSLTVQDFVFQKGDYDDPFYSEKRTKAILIGTDCTDIKETCFCLAMDGAPYPRKYFDIALSPSGENLIAEVATEKGRQLVDSFRMFFRPADSSSEASRKVLRDKAQAEVADFINRRGTRNTADIKGAVKRSYDSTGMWQDFASTCVECGACNLVCPTCHCFLLFDEKSNGMRDRFREWDSCLYKTFARVAGGANPRRHLYERLRNRFDKKFEFFPQVLDYFACTGCGRCIEACPGDIDIREVLKGAVLGKWEKPPHK
jgi:ferredoxin